MSIQAVRRSCHHQPTCGKNPKLWHMRMRRSRDWIMSHIVLSSPLKVNPRCLHGNKVRGVQPKLCLVWRYQPRRTPYTKPIRYPVSARTLRTPSPPPDGLLVNPLCRQQKIWARTQSPNHVIHHLWGQRSLRVAARRSCRGQRLMRAWPLLSFSWHHRSSSPHVIRATHDFDNALISCCEQLWCFHTDGQRCRKRFN